MKNFLRIVPAIVAAALIAGCDDFGSIQAFDSIPDPIPSNIPSYGVEALSGTAAPVNTIGDRITLEANTPRGLRKVSVLLKSYACQSGQWNVGTTCASEAGAKFSHPVTLTIYDESDVVIATQTQTFDMPYRPSADLTCAQPGYFRDKNNNCDAGITFPIAFDLASLNVTLPDTLHYEVSFNTTNGGPNPIHGTAGPYPYDSLNYPAMYHAVDPIKGTHVGDYDALIINGVTTGDSGSLLVQFDVAPAGANIQPIQQQQ